MQQLFLETGNNIIIPEINYSKESLIVASILMVNDDKIDIDKKFLTYFGDSMIVGMDINRPIYEDNDSIRIKFRLSYNVNYRNRTALIYEENPNPYVTLHGVKFGSKYIKGYNLLII
jgi:hypothetical protein